MDELTPDMEMSSSEAAAYLKEAIRVFCEYVQL